MVSDNGNISWSQVDVPLYAPLKMNALSYNDVAMPEVLNYNTAPFFVDVYKNHMLDARTVTLRVRYAGLPEMSYSQSYTEQFIVKAPAHSLVSDFTEWCVRGVSAELMEKTNISEWPGVFKFIEKIIDYLPSLLSNRLNKGYATGGVVSDTDALVCTPIKPYENQANGPDVLSLLSSLMEDPGVLQKMVEPPSSHVAGHKKEYAPLSGVIMSLNDNYKWTREQIADWLETLDLNIKFKIPEKENKDA